MNFVKTDVNVNFVKIGICQHVMNSSQIFLGVVSVGTNLLDIRYVYVGCPQNSIPRAHVCSLVRQVFYREKVLQHLR